MSTNSDCFKFKNNQNKNNTYSIDTPPPTVSGLLHMGHIFSYCHCDFIARFNRMNGKDVFYPIGFDDNGLPTERLVEKKEKIRAVEMVRNGKKNEFLSKFHKTLAEDEQRFESLFRELNFSFDWTKKYQTISPAVQKIAHMSFADLFYKGLIYLAKAPVYWDTVDQTALAQADIEEKELDSEAYNLIFPLYCVKNQNPQNKAETFKNFTSEWISGKIASPVNVIEIMTTRPELLPACVCLLYNPNDDRYNGKKENQSVKITQVDGAEIQTTGINAENLIAITPLKKPIPIFPHKDVVMEKGTGIVMCCTFGDWQDVIWINDLTKSNPKYEILSNAKNIINSYGLIADDYYLDYPELAKKTHIPKDDELNNKNAKSVNSARKNIKEILSNRSIKINNSTYKVVTKVKSIRHTVKCGERSGKPIEIINRSQWYVDLGTDLSASNRKMVFYINKFNNCENTENQQTKRQLFKKAKQEKTAINTDSKPSVLQEWLLKSTEAIEFKPNSMRKKLTTWINGLNQNWCISRNRFAGISIPSVKIAVSKDRTKVAIVPFCEQLFKDEYRKLQSIKLNQEESDDLVQIIKTKAKELKISRTEYINRSIKGDNQIKWIKNINDELQEMGGLNEIIDLLEESEMVFDTWFTSSLSPQINTGVVTMDSDLTTAFNVNKESIELHKKLYPFNLRSQAHEIIRTWTFYTICKACLHAAKWSEEKKKWILSGNHNPKEQEEDITKIIPWNRVMLSGWCLASDKTKMSKSKGNIVDPLKLLKNHESDAIRYWAASGHLGVDTPYNEKNIKIGSKLIKKLLNVSTFCEMHQDNFLYFSQDIKTLLENNTISQTMDKWILCKMSKMVQNYYEYFEDSDYCRALETLEEFFWVSFCQNYMEIIKGRIYGESSFIHKEGLYAQDKISTKDILSLQQSAISTLFYVFNCLVRLFAPFLPNTADCLFQKKHINKYKLSSVHDRNSFDSILPSITDESSLKLGEEMILILTEIRKYKANNNLSIKAPIKTIKTPTFSPKYELDLRSVSNALSAEITKTDGKIIIL